MRYPFSLFLLISFACNPKPEIVYELYANGDLICEIVPSDIQFYDTTQSRGYTEIHELRLRDGFYPEDSVLLVAPLTLSCLVNGRKYFAGEHFYGGEGSLGLTINFHFDPSCDNELEFREGGARRAFRGDTIILYTKNECNSIELFHKKKRINQIRESFYDKEPYFKNFVDTARLAHEILLDPYYLNAIKASGIEIR